MKKILIAIFMTLAMQSAWAIDIHSAKDQGLVGEGNNGYLASVTASPSAEVQALIADVNQKRKAEFQQTAKKTTATVAQVAARFYELAVSKTEAGHYYQDPSGQWIKK